MNVDDYRKITTVKVHPAIGIARVGNSPDGYFIGPERRWQTPNPTGGFKDAGGRIKRQAARFRLYGYDAAGKPVGEITALNGVSVTWQVRLANRKASLVKDDFNKGEDPTALTIAPSPRQITVTEAGAGPNQRFDDGKITFKDKAPVVVPLGEIRAEAKGRLLVLGGFGRAGSPTGADTDGIRSAGWYDDISDGPVTAVVTLPHHDTPITAVGGWVVVGPPHYAPDLKPPITLFDRVFDEVCVANGAKRDHDWPSTPEGGKVPSYTRHVHPILESARRIKWVYADADGNHPRPGDVHSDWGKDPAYRQSAAKHVLRRLRPPTGSFEGVKMPLLAETTEELARPTATQREIIEKWSEGSFSKDWDPPAPSKSPDPADPDAIADPAEIDRAALEPCIGAAYFPGIETGALPGSWDSPQWPGEKVVPIIDPANFRKPENPSGLTDFLRIKDTVKPGGITMGMGVPWQVDFGACGGNWWPVPRPEQVRTAAEPDVYKYWARDHSGDKMLYYWGTAGIVVKDGDSYLEKGHVTPPDVQLVTRSLDFGVDAKHHVRKHVQFTVKNPDREVTLHLVTLDTKIPRRLKVEPSMVKVPAGQDQTTVKFTVTYTGAAAAEKTAATLRITDVDTNNQWVIPITAKTKARLPVATTLVLTTRGTAAESAADAASVFVELMRDRGDFALVGVGRDSDSQAPTAIPLGSMADDEDRERALDAIGGLTLAPSGQAASVTDGVAVAEQLLNSSDEDTHAGTAVVVIADGASSFDATDQIPPLRHATYVIDVAPGPGAGTAQWHSTAGNSGGALLAAERTGSSRRFSISRRLAQVLSEVDGSQVAADVEGLVGADDQAVPFLLTEHDTSAEIILLTPDAEPVDLRLRTPNGFLLDATHPALTHRSAAGVTVVTIALPAATLYERVEHHGRWHAVVSSISADDELIPYALRVHARSSLATTVHVEQSSHQTGTAVPIHVGVTDGGLPAELDAAAVVEVTRPDGTTDVVALERAEPGRFTGMIPTTTSGTYQYRVRVTGESARGCPFERHHLASAGVWRGADREPTPLVAAAIPRQAARAGVAPRSTAARR
ncbi:MAG: hypothetical protein HOY78_34455 [Saccharothrix sp.]|nr:hypothetical protein [Saccharothrix sp.]